MPPALFLSWEEHVRIARLLAVCSLLIACIGCVSRPQFKPTVESSEEFRIEYGEDEEQAEGSE